MRWFAPGFTVAIGLSLAACSPAEAPTVDNPETPPATETVDATTPDSGSPAPQVVHYDCEGTPVDATFDGHGQVSVAVDGAHHVLRTEDGPTGTKYMDEAGIVLWTRGGHDALLTRPDHPDRTCTGAPAAPL